MENAIGFALKIVDWLNDEALMLKMLKDERAIGNISESGAHAMMFCGVGDIVHLLTKYVSDEKRLMSEETVRVLMVRPRAISILTSVV